MTAFVLFFVMLALTVACGLGVWWLASSRVYLDGGKQMREDMYAGLCYGELYRAADVAIDTALQYGVTTDVATGTVGIPDVAQTEFRNAMSGSNCVFQIVDNIGGNVIASTGEAPTKYLYYAETDFSGASAEEMTTGDWDVEGAMQEAGIDPAAYTIRAWLPVDFPGNSYNLMLGNFLLNWRIGIIVLGILFGALTVFFFGFSMAGAGHWQGYEDCHLTWFDKIPLDICLLAGLCLFSLMVESYDDILQTVLGVLLAVMALLLCISFAARCKAGTVLKNTAIAWLLRMAWRVICWGGRLLAGVPLVWKTVLGATVGMIAVVICLSNHHDSEFLVVLFLLALVCAVGAVFVAEQLRKLEQGGKALSEGDYSRKVETRHLVGAFKRHAEHLNSMQEGVQKAVAEQLKSERMRTELITNVSHDIKTPLTSIVNYVDLLKKEEITNPTAVEYIAVLDRQSARLKKLTEDLVEASKAATGNISVTLTDTDVNVLLAQVAGEYEQRLEEKQLTAVLSLPERAPHVLADGRLLWRVLDNLMSNVCKYAMPGTRVYLTAESRGGRVHMAVKNISQYPLNISAEELTERFVRGDSSRHTEGSGLGLNIAASLTKLQGGELQLTVDGDLFKAEVMLDEVPWSKETDI